MGAGASDVLRLIAGVANPFARTAIFWSRSTRYPFDYRPKRRRHQTKCSPTYKFIAKQATFWPGSTRYPSDYGSQGNQLQQKCSPICKVITKQATFWPRSTSLLTIDPKGIGSPKKASIDKIYDQTGHFLAKIDQVPF